MKDALIVTMLSVVPKSWTARLMGAFSRTPLPRVFHRALLRWYVRHYGVSLDECQGGIDDFPTLARFFIRELRPGVRPIDPDPQAMVSPADARTYSFGTIQRGSFDVAEGRAGSVANLLGPGLDPARFEGGSYAILYLSPKDYHRVHSPLQGRVKAIRYRPGRLWPVFPAATRRIDNLFDLNERLLFQLDTDFGTVIVAMIGAFGVGRMSTPHAELITNTGGPAEDLGLDLPVARGQELGRFEMGSTVILLAEPGRLQWQLTAGEPVRLGRPIARQLG